MSTPKFAVVAILEKPEESNGFEEMIGILNASSVQYALTVNPTIYTTCIEQFWTSAKLDDAEGTDCLPTATIFVELEQMGSVQYALTVNQTIYTACIEQFWTSVKLDDAEGTDCLPTATIFVELEQMGYENLTQKLTFYKASFSSQWKFLIHTILQCLSAKTTSWNEFSSTMASDIICLATNQKFNLSK
ncbi:hypothetical protein Tco_0075577, partial [Tanacetum coccineum]